MLGVFLLLVMTVGDVLGRFFFNHPIPGTFELTKLFLALTVFFSLPISQYMGENLGITIIYDRLPRRGKGVLDFIGAVISIVIFSVAFSQILKYAARMKAANTITSVLRLPLYPWIYLASIGILILVIALLRDLMVSINELKGGEHKGGENDES
jgi:TRAP-type C4-dicarboxylate transport system permease small subunit